MHLASFFHSFLGSNAHGLVFATSARNWPKTWCVNSHDPSPNLWFSYSSPYAKPVTRTQRGLATPGRGHEQWYYLVSKRIRFCTFYPNNNMKLFWIYYIIVVCVCLSLYVNVLKANFENFLHPQTQVAQQDSGHKYNPLHPLHNSHLPCTTIMYSTTNFGKFCISHEYLISN